MIINHKGHAITSIQRIGLAIFGLLMVQSQVEGRPFFSTLRRAATFAPNAVSNVVSNGSSVTQSSTTNTTSTSANTDSKMQSNAITMLNNNISLTNTVGAGSFYNNVNMGNVTIAPYVTNYAQGGTMTTAGASGNTMSSQRL